MVVSVVAVLAACKDNPTGGDYPEGLPVEEGKITFYVEIDYDMPTYASPFLLGPYLLPEGQTEWAPNAAEMKNLKDTKIWYYVLEKAELDQTIEKWNNYMIDLGYNAASGLPADKQGESGTYIKSDNTAANAGESGMDNPSFEYKAGDRAINLGKDSFTLNGSKMEEPATIKTTLCVSIEADLLGEHSEVLFMGGFNGWDASKAKATPNADYTEWRLALNDVLCTDYEYKILICQDTTKIDQETLANGVWDAMLAEKVNGYSVKAYVEVNAQGGNMSVSIKKVNNNSTVDLAGTNRKTEDRSVLRYDDHQLKQDDEKKIISPYIDIVKTVEVTFEVKFAAKLEGVHVWMMGAFNGWSEGAAVEFTSTDGITWTAKYQLDKAKLGDKDVEFKIIVNDKATFSWGGGSEYGEGGAIGAGNAKFDIPAEITGTISVFGTTVLPVPTAAE